MLKLTEKKIHEGSLILVNQHYRAPEEPEDILVPALDRIPGILLQRCAAALLNELMQEIHGWRSIVPVSGYRPQKEQERIWDDSLRENGPEFTEKYVAFPGHSEHQTGLAIDLGLKQEHIDFIRPDFPNAGICRIFRERAARYGFVLRYPQGKEAVTGISHEPWHFRYVGIPHAEIMTERGLTLEEYIEFVKQFPYGCRFLPVQSSSREIRVSYLSAAEAIGAELTDEFPCIVSGNNTDGYILTEWRQKHERAKAVRTA